MFYVFLAPFDGAAFAFPWGLPGDFPLVLDTIGDGKLDLVVFRAALGAFFVRSSFPADFLNIALANFVFRFSSLPLYRYFYLNGATPNDFNRDHRSDVPIHFDAGGLKYWDVSLLDGNLIQMQFGLAGDDAIAGDIEGDQVVQPVAVRKVGGFLDWFFLLSSGQVLHVPAFGLEGDTPLLGDLDCDGKDDMIVTRGSGVLRDWFWRISSAQFADFGFGVAGFGLADDLGHVDAPAGPPECSSAPGDPGWTRFR